MHRSVLTFLFVLSILPAWTGSGSADAQSLASLARPTALRSTEQEWIVSQVIARIAEIEGIQVGDVAVKQAQASGRGDTAFAVTLGARATMSVVVVDHLWSPATFRPVAEQLLRTSSAKRPRSPAATVAFRDALTDLTVETLIEENEHLSVLLRTDRYSPELQESAALLIGAFALREAAGIFHDVRPALSRMTAHLAIARALRPAGPESRDGLLARTILTALVGRQREAMSLIAAFDRQAEAEADRQWVRALTLRVTGDWRALRPPTESVLERLERARAIRDRLDTDAFLDYLDTFPEDDLIDWQRLVFLDGFTVGAGNRLMQQNLQWELDEAKWLWSQFHDGEPTMETTLDALNARPVRAAETETLQVLDWPMWAAHQQRHLAHALIATAHYEGLLRGGNNKPILEAYDATFSRLTLYPIIVRYLAPDVVSYERSLAAARLLVETRPELISPTAWTMFVDRPSFMQRSPSFPRDLSWFNPVVPVGTAFELEWRALRPGRQQRATRVQTAWWAVEAPYDRYAPWGHAWIDGTPSFETARRALAPLLEYDSEALELLTFYTAMTHLQRIELAIAACRLVAGTCRQLGEMLLLIDRVVEAAGAYERWAMETRDRVAVSNGVTWLVRYHHFKGNRAVAERLAHAAGETYSSRGLEELAEWLDREGRHAEAETMYRKITERYPRDSEALGIFLLRKAARTGDAALYAQADELLRNVFPNGLERVGTTDRPAVPSDGITFVTFGDRAAASGVRPTDIIVGVDGWRVRTTSQFAVAIRFRQDDMMMLTIWRDGRYEELPARVPERWFGTRFKNHQAQPPSR